MSSTYYQEGYDAFSSPAWPVNPYEGTTAGESWELGWQDAADDAIRAGGTEEA